MDLLRPSFRRRSVWRPVPTENLYDTEFVSRWTCGFDQLKAHVQKYTPQWAAHITGLPVEQIERVARLYATTKPACVYHGNGSEHAPSCNDAIRAVSSFLIT
jgi:anaerobic selenocysteine-containing dehydrogenase